MIKETLIKPNSPRSNPYIRAAEFGTLRFNHRVLTETLIKPNSPRSKPNTRAAESGTLRFNYHVIRKTAAGILAAVLLAAAPAYSAQAAQSASSQQLSCEWDGVSALEAGKSYVLSADAVIRSRVVIPAGTKLTVTGGRLLAASSGTLCVKGSLVINKGAQLAVNGTLKLYSVGRLTVSGKMTLGSKSREIFNGKLTAKKTSDVSGEPRTLIISDKAEISLSGALSSEKLSLAVYYDQKDGEAIHERLSDCLSLLVVEQDGYGAVRKYLPEKTFEYIEAKLGKDALQKACGNWRSKLLSALPSGTDLNSITEIDLGALQIDYCDSSYITGFVNASAVGKEIGTALAYNKGKLGRGDLLAVYSGSCKAVTGTGEEYEIYLRGSFIKINGSWYILT